MPEDFIVRKQINIRAEPAQVWAALTNPELTKKYFYGCKVYSKWEVGSPITWRRKILWMKVELKGRITQIESEKRLQYTLKNTKSAKSGQPASQSLVTDVLTYKDGVTTLSITDDVGKGEGAEKRYRKSVKGWGKMLKDLKQLLEEQKTA